VLTRRSAEHARRQQLGEHGTAVDARTKNEVDQAFSAESHRQFCHNRLRSKISRSYSTIYNLTPARTKSSISCSSGTYVARLLISVDGPIRSGSLTWKAYIFIATA
jgi:hypothetical protein